jgi:hypothetical protein
MKDGIIEKRIFDYEQQLVNALDSFDDVFVKKARGLAYIYNCPDATETDTKKTVRNNRARTTSAFIPAM